MPVVIRTRGPNRGNVTMLDTFELSRMQPTKGRNSSPQTIGL